jgi:uncharacterized membrane protein
MAKTATFGVLHLGTSFGVTFALTGSVAVAGAVTFVEPLVNTVMHHFFDKHWPQLAAKGQALRQALPVRLLSRRSDLPEVA